MDATKKKLAVGAVAVAALAGGGAAIAAGGIGSSEEQQAILDDAAKKLGVEPEALETALEDAFAARLDEAVAAGRLTEEQATELKERMKDGTLPLFGARGPGHHGFRFHGPELLDVAASYLGLSEEALRAQLEDGKSLADVAEAQGKSVNGLETALTNAVKKDLDEAVEAGKLTDAQRDEALSRFEERLDDLVAREGFGPVGKGEHRPAGFEGGPGMPM
jgi:lipoate-protein ligase A